MALIHRLNRLFRADMNAVLDRLEEPELLLRQSIRDMEHQITLKRIKTEELERTIEDVRDQLDQITTQLTTNEQEIDLCVTQGNNPLLRTAVKRKLERQSRQQYLQQSLKGLDTELSSTQSQLEEETEQLESIRQKASLLSEPCLHSMQNQDTLNPADIDLAVLRELEKRSAS